MTILRNIFLTSCLLCCALWAATQAYPGQSQSSTSGASDSKETKIEGCLTGTNGNYILSTDSGKTYQLAGDTSTLSEHVGHKVKVSGTVTAANADSSGATGAPTSTGETSQPTLSVTSVKHIAKTCQ